MRRLRLKCDGTRAETIFRLSAKRTSPFKSDGASVQSTTGSRGVRISSSNAGYTMFRGSVKGTGYPLHSPVSPSLPLPCVTVCHHISTGLYLKASQRAQSSRPFTQWLSCRLTFWSFNVFSSPGNIYNILQNSWLHFILQRDSDDIQLSSSGGIPLPCNLFVN